MASLPLAPQPPDKRLVCMALLVALGVILHRVEALLPLPAPWIKLGLANVMTLLALVFLGFKEALVVTGVRIFLGSIIGGTFLGPTFFLSLAGGLAAILAMTLVYRRDGGPFSLIGVSVVGAYAHILAIIFSVYFVFIPQNAFLHLLPIFLSLALVSGILTGIAANILSARLTEAKVTFR
jgi:heptaprenyl diphosphate synthase